MKASLLAISNNRNSNMRYLPALQGYGYSVNDVQTFAAARTLLKTGYQADIIVIDVKFHEDDVIGFLQFVRHELANQSAHIIVIGNDDFYFAAYGANTCLQRPTNIEDILAVLEPSY